MSTTDARGRDTTDWTMTDQTTAKREVYRRAFGYFARDWPWIVALVLLISINVGVGLLEAWPLAVLVDSVLTREPRGDWIHGWFLALLPSDKPGQIVGLVLIGLALQIIGYGAWMAIHPDDRAASRETFRAAIVKRASFQIESRVRRYDGSYRWALSTAAPRFAGLGEDGPRHPRALGGSRPGDRRRESADQG